MKLLNKVNNSLEEIDLNEAMLPANPNPQQVIQSIAVWSPVIIIILEFVKLFTGPKADSKIDALIATLRITSFFK